MHIIEHPAGHLVMKKLIQQDKETQDTGWLIHLLKSSLHVLVKGGRQYGAARAVWFPDLGVRVSNPSRPFCRPCLDTTACIVIKVVVKVTYSCFSR